jgi:L-iditol 2-dehydrogenase
MSEILACCINAQKNTPVKKGDSVLIIGSGPAGALHSQLAYLSGAKKVIITQRSKPRLEMIKKKFKVDRIIASSEENLTEAVMAETNGEGADVIFVCAPSRTAQEQATELIAPRGRINFFGGLPKEDCVIRLDANKLHYKEFFIGGASSSLPDGNREALQLLADRKIDPDLLITNRLSIDNIHEGFDIVEQRTGLKVVINPSL